MCVWKAMDPPPGMERGDACECRYITFAAFFASLSRDFWASVRETKQIQNLQKQTPDRQLK